MTGQDSAISDTPAAVDLHLVMDIVRRTGLECEVVRRDDADLLLRARQPGSPTWTVHAGLSRRGTGGRPPGAFVGPAGAARVRRLHGPDERRVAALIMAQAHDADPTRALSQDTISALGLGSGTRWA